MYTKTANKYFEEWKSRKVVDCKEH